VTISGAQSISSLPFCVCRCSYNDQPWRDDTKVPQVTQGKCRL